MNSIPLRSDERLWIRGFIDIIMNIHILPLTIEHIQSMKRIITEERKKKHGKKKSNKFMLDKWGSVQLKRYVNLQIILTIIIYIKYYDFKVYNNWLNIIFSSLK